MKTKVKRAILKISVIIFASIIYAAGISLFLDPNKLAPGGITGIAIIINHVFGIKTGTMTLLINIPLMIIGIRKFGVKFFGTTILTLVVSSLAMNIFSSYGALTTDPLLASIAGSILAAGGIGIIFRAGGTTGGSDIIVKLLRLKYKHIKTGVLFLISDGVVVTISGVIFQELEVALYAAISVLIQALVIDKVLYGADGARTFHIISDKEQEITDRLLKELEIGVTFLNGSGAYTNKEKRVLMCVMRTQMVPKAREIVYEVDPDAFMIISSAIQVFGEGYKNNGKADL